MRSKQLVIFQLGHVFLYISVITQGVTPTRILPRDPFWGMLSPFFNIFNGFGHGAPNQLAGSTDFNNVDFMTSPKNTGFFSSLPRWPTRPSRNRPSRPVNVNPYPTQSSYPSTTQTANPLPTQAATPIIVPSVPDASTNSTDPSSAAPTFTTQADSPTATPVAPVAIPSNTCSTIQVRKEWRNMDRASQKSYISAIKCLLSKPSTIKPNSNLRLYDDFVSVHDRSRTSVHWVGAFLPWHRHFIHLQEQALQACGYAGALPRWDWSLDSLNMTTSPVWSSDSEVGFGSNGADFLADPDGLGGGTVVDGAFARLQLLYPDQHLLERGFNSPSSFNRGGSVYGSQYFDAKALAVVQSSRNYLNFHVAVEGTYPLSSGPDLPGPHGAIHTVIGGDMSPTSYAANDPIFYLHHANVDYHWAKWQSASPDRLSDYSGNRVQGKNVNDVKITDQLKFLGFSPDVTVQQAMDTTAYPYCYTYE